MNREFEIHVYLDVSKDFKYKLVDRLANVVFESAKNSVGIIVSGKDCDPIHIIHGWGSHADAVRVYSALRNNKYSIVYCEGV